MLRQTFVHLPGVGAARENALWNRGIRDWSEFARQAPELLGPAQLTTITAALAESEAAWARKDLHHFYRALPRAELWRLLPGNLDRIAYLDIETTGMGFPPLSHSTTITFYYQGQVLQAHDHADKRRLIHEVMNDCKILVTFYGEVFDVPYLRREFDHPFQTAHIDLCFWLKRLGYKGGLKRVQKMFPDIPERLSLDIDGFDAVRLWGLHRKGVEGALETLLTYNAEDTVVLEALLAKAYELELLKRGELGCGVSIDPWTAPAPAGLTTNVDHRVYDMLRQPR